MATAFFVCDAGDTDLAWETILNLSADEQAEEILLYPISAAAEKRVRDKYSLLPKPLPQLKINAVITETNIDALSQNKSLKRAYIGVPSAAQDLPYKIALQLNIPCIFAYEFMFKPKNHGLFTYLPLLQGKKNISFAVSLETAAPEIRSYGFEANPIGHLSIDRASLPATVNKASVRQKLEIESAQELVFVSATTQPSETDMNFLRALLSELATEKYPHLQLRFGLHPGIKDMPAYFEALNTVLMDYPHTSKQFKIILPQAIEEKLNNTLHVPEHFILRCEVNGADAGSAADRVAQAVLGALPTEAVLRGKPAYAHEGDSYLPKGLLAMSLPDFFTRTPSSAPKRETLGIASDEEAPKILTEKIKRLRV